MKTQINSKNPNILETLFQEFNGNNIYGLEFILDELVEKKGITQSEKNDSASIDWFGLSDLSI